MAKRTRLQRGFWDSVEGRMLLNRVRRKELTPQELAQQLHTTEGAIYNALSKRNLRQAPVSVASDPALDRLLASAEEFLGTAVMERLKALQRERDDAVSRAETAERELATLQNKALDQSAMVHRLQSRLAERITRSTEEAQRDV